MKKCKHAIKPVPCKLDCKTACIFLRFESKESKEKSGVRVKTEIETGERISRRLAKSILSFLQSTCMLNHTCVIYLRLTLPRMHMNTTEHDRNSKKKNDYNINEDVDVQRRTIQNWPKTVIGRERSSILINLHSEN